MPQPDLVRCRSASLVLLLNGTLLVALLGACTDEQDEARGNHRPTVTGLQASTDEDTPVTIDILSSVVDPDGDPLRLEVTSAPGGQAIRNADGTVTFTPSANFHGSVTLVYEVSDGKLASTGSVSITVRPVADAPLARAQSVVVQEDLPRVVDLDGFDSDNDPLTFEVSAPPAHGTLSGTSPHFTYTPAPNFFGFDSALVTASDGALVSAPVTISFTVLAVNDAPVAPPQTAEATEDTTLSIALQASDVEGDAMTYQLASIPAHGTLSGTGATRSYQPQPNYHGADSFTYVAKDATGVSGVATVTIDVAPVEDPTTAESFSVAATEDTAAAVALRGADLDGTPLGYAVETPPEHGTLSGTPPALTYTPAADYNGADTFTYVVASGASTSPAATVTLNVAARNDAPVASDGAVTTAEDTAVTITLQASDVDSPTLFYSPWEPVDGTLTGSGVTRTYTPAANVSGTRAIVFSVNDGLLSSSATITVTITPVNDRPVGRADYAATGVDESFEIDVLANDTDLEGDALTLQTVADPPHGTAVIENGVLGYTPDAGYTGVDIFTYTVVDDEGASTNVAVRVGVGTFPANAPQETLVAATGAVPGSSDSSRMPSISDDGRFVAFASLSALLPEDTNSTTDIYLYDRGHRQLRRVSVAQDGTQANSTSLNPHLSGNGRFVVFESWATNLVPGDTNTGYDIFRCDLVTGEVVRVNVSSAGAQANATSERAKISDDGNLVTFVSSAFNLVTSDANGVADVFVRNISAGTTVRASVNVSGGDADLASQQPMISGDGGFVAFVSRSTNLVPGDNNGSNDVFLRDLSAGTTTRASVSTNGGESNGSSSNPSLSRDGRVISFSSSATNLVPSGVAGTYVRDLSGPITTLPVSSGQWPQLSDDSRYLTLHSPGSAFVFDRLAARSFSLPLNTTRWPVLSGNGRYVVFIESTNGAIVVAPNPL